MRKIKKFIFSIVVSIIILCILELCIELLLQHPLYIPDRFMFLFKKYYEMHDRTIIQYNTNYSKYDKQLFYTLKPGIFNFTNREFDVVFWVNNIGLRDESSSLEFPKIIVTGDSHAMGWGVEQGKTFAQLLEKEQHIKVLNAAISSYGTTRELKMLERINTDSLQYLIIQYGSNDYAENLSFFKNNNELIISDKAKYDEIISEHKTNTNYFAGKHLYYFCGIIGQEIKHKLLGNKHIVETNEIDECDAFLNVLLHSKIDFNKTKIIVFILDCYLCKDNFTNNLKERLKTDKYFKLQSAIKIIDFSKILDKSSYFVLDAHINAKGHRIIANELKKVLIL